MAMFMKTTRSPMLLLEKCPEGIQEMSNQYEERRWGERIYFSKAMAAQISRVKNPHTSLHTYAKNVPEATRKKIYKAANGQ